MKRIMSLLALCFSLCAATAFPAVVEDWSAVTNSNTGTYADSNGSKIEFEAIDGPNGGKALQITSTVVQGGYCGIWHNITGDLSKDGSLKFQAKSTVAGEAQMTLMDAFNVQYVASFQVGTTSADVTVPFSSFKKDATYTPPAAVLGHPMDLSKVSGMNFSPHMGGSSVLVIGAVQGVEGGAPVAAPAAAAAPSSPGLAQPIVVQNYSDFDMKSAGTYHDSQGSTVDFKLLDNKKGGKMFAVTYSLKGDYCGVWCRAGGNDWAGVKATGANQICLTVYSKQPIDLTVDILDKNKNQFTSNPSSLKGGSWETICIPFSSYTPNPYVPAVVKGAPMDFSVIKQFNIQPNTKGDNITFCVSNVTVK